MAIEALIARHKQAFVAGDVDGLMVDYADDAVMLVKGMPPVKGAHAIRAMYDMIFTGVFPPTDTEVTFDPVIVEGDVALLPFSATTSTAKSVAGQDSFVVRDGKIAVQFAGGDIVSLTGEALAFGS
jgi:uncharacterized protein (TIGR02246 family)